MSVLVMVFLFCWLPFWILFSMVAPLCHDHEVRQMFMVVVLHTRYVVFLVPREMMPTLGRAKLYKLIAKMC